MEQSRWVRVVRSEGVGPDSIMTVADPGDPAWPAVTLGTPGRAAVGAEGYLRFIPGRSYPRREAGWAFRPIETGREEAAGMPGTDGSAPPGAIGDGG